MLALAKFNPSPVIPGGLPPTQTATQMIIITSGSCLLVGLVLSRVLLCCRLSSSSLVTSNATNNKTNNNNHHHNHHPCACSLEQEGRGNAEGRWSEGRGGKTCVFACVFTVNHSQPSVNHTVNQQSTKQSTTEPFEQELYGELIEGMVFMLLPAGPSFNQIKLIFLMGWIIFSQNVVCPYKAPFLRILHDSGFG